MLFKKGEQTTHGINHDDEICKRLNKIKSEAIIS
jgi:hypothetical protein